MLIYSKARHTRSSRLALLWRTDECPEEEERRGEGRRRIGVGLLESRWGGGVLEEEKEEEREVDQVQCFSDVTRWDNARRSQFHRRVCLTRWRGPVTTGVYENRCCGGHGYFTPCT